ncbi:MAG: hypothetical protein BWK76_07405 [Desulfobulbaceae bacterium A2]|nr:MAG: hypothetical protein BWK76_07405 [Desulfobulbaceae bacterium A2]
MATVSYPGVYIEEVPSGVRTITGVSTSVTAFVGYTRRGATNTAIKVFSFGEFEREFGGLHLDSDLSYAVYQFFQNGGTEACIVRVAAGAQQAGITLASDISGASPVLAVQALSEGAWGNCLRLDVAYDTTNPASLFNLTVTEYQEVNGRLRAGRSETHRNLGMNSFLADYAVGVVKANSSLIRLERLCDPHLLDSVFGWSLSGDLSGFDFATLDDDHRRLALTINGEGPCEFDLFDAGGSITDLADLAVRLENRVRTLTGAPAVFHDFTCVVDGGNCLLASSGVPGERSEVHFSDARSRNAARLLSLGILNGGREQSAAATLRPVQTGTVSTLDLSSLDFTALPNELSDMATLSVGGTAQPGITVPLWTAATKPTTAQALRTRLQEALRGVARAELNGATVSLADNRLRIVANGTDPNVHVQLTSPQLGFADATVNTAQYALGVGRTFAAQSSPVPGTDGLPPLVADLRGSRTDKTGLYALEDTDLFNILVLPNVADVALLTDALDYCEERRAFLLIDIPETIDTLPEAIDWLEANASLRHKNAAAYFPRIEAADPLQGSRLRPFATSGAVAGLYARTDSERGVWKSPAGIDAVLRGVTKLAYTLSDQENGIVNPLGLNAIRSFPVQGSVVWGARTLQGADVLASEWKYIPVRRLTLYIEESLYRGTQWVVFEPNDEPLWAQIRLNVGAFMMGLFRRGAFQGTTPDKAFFVKCDGETTTQADRNLGIVHIDVGFAPLKPAEFVVIRIQQMAGDLG